MREYVLPEMLPGETRQEWVDRAARSIPPEAIIKQLVLYLDRRHERSRLRRDGRWKGEAWSVIGDVTSHGSGVSTAICNLYRNWEPPK